MAAFIEVWRVFIMFVVADLHTRNSGGLVINRDPQFFSHLLSKLQVLHFTVMFDVTLSVANWYIVHKFTGDL